MAAPDTPTPEEAERHIRKLLADNDLREPDEITYDEYTDELYCRWDDEKLVVCIELSERAAIRPPV
jgi:hypothetical protein